MPLGGRKLTLEEALALCRVAGFVGRDQVVTSVALMCSESGRYVEAYNINANVNDDGTVNKSIDRGLFQINSLHQKLGMAQSFRAWPNAKFAYRLSKQGTDFTPWMAFVNGAHDKFVAEVTAVWEADEWRVLVPTIREVLA